MWAVHAGRIPTRRVRLAAIMRSVVEPGAILATGIDVAAIRALAWSQTHLLFDQATTGEAVEFPVNLRDLDERRQSARFVVRG
jgi:hypothetical protein